MFLFNSILFKNRGIFSKSTEWKINITLYYRCVTRKVIKVVVVDDDDVGVVVKDEDDAYLVRFRSGMRNSMQFYMWHMIYHSSFRVSYELQ